MNIMGLQKWSRRKKVGYKLIWIGVALIMAVGTIQSFGGGRGAGGGRGGAVSPAPDPIATVAGVPISRQVFNQRLAQQMMMMGGRSPDPGILSFIKQNAFNGGEQSVVVGTLLEQEAVKLGVSVSDADINKTIDSNVETQMSMLRSGRNPKRVQREIETKYGGMEAFKEQMRKEMGENSSEVKHNLVLQRLHDKITGEVKVTEKDYLESLKKVNVRHILVKPKTPAPGKAADAKAKADTANPDSDARQEATQILKTVKEHPDKFGFFAKQSDEVTFDKKGKQITAAENGGLIGWVGHNEKKWQYGDDYEQSVFKAKAGEIIDRVIKCTDGYRVVKVEEVKNEFPKDYNKVTYKCENKNVTKSGDQSKAADKAKSKDAAKEEGKDAAKEKTDKGKPCDYQVDSEKQPDKCPKCGSTKFKVVSKQKDTLFNTFKQQKQEEHWRELVAKVGKDADAKVQIYDPELLAMKMENEAQADPAKLRTVADKYKEALKYANSDPFIKPAALHMHLANVYLRLGEKSNQVAALKEALKIHPDANLDLQLANLLIEQWEGQHGDKDAKKSADAKKAKAEALDHLQEASRGAGDQQPFHTSIADAYKRIGMIAEEKIEREKAKPKTPPITRKDATAKSADEADAANDKDAAQE